MILAGLFAGLLLLMMLAADWWHFSRLSEPASRYGCRVAVMSDVLPGAFLDSVAARFDANGLLRLEHGVACLFPVTQRILLRPQYHLFSVRFRTAWPIKGAVEYSAQEDSLRLRCLKFMPWSSSLITLLWFGIVSVGTVAFVVRFLLEGGTASLGSLLVGLGITALGLLVFAFGLITVSLAYRLEDARLMQVYQELRAVLTGGWPQRDVKSDKK